MAKGAARLGSFSAKLPYVFSQASRYSGPSFNVMKDEPDSFDVFLNVSSNSEKSVNEAFPERLFALRFAYLEMKYRVIMKIGIISASLVTKITDQVHCFRQGYHVTTN